MKRSIGNIQLDYKLHFFPDLHANVNLGYDITRSQGSIYIPASSSIAYTAGARTASTGRSGTTSCSKPTSAIPSRLVTIAWRPSPATHSRIFSV
ncbi:MAG: hypothetical protein WKG07_05675 [Hymenobacter sp.]